MNGPNVSLRSLSLDLPPVVTVTVCSLNKPEHPDTSSDSSLYPGDPDTDLQIQVVVLTQQL